MKEKWNLYLGPSSDTNILCASVSPSVKRGGWDMMTSEVPSSCDIPSTLDSKRVRWAAQGILGLLWESHSSPLPAIQ